MSNGSAGGRLRAKERTRFPERRRWIMSKSPDAFRTISEVAEDLDLPQHVLRFWETRFAQIRPMKRGGGRRYYRPDDVDLLRGIRYLLYGEGYTIRGVQRILKEQGPRFVDRRRPRRGGGPCRRRCRRARGGRGYEDGAAYRAAPRSRGIATGEAPAIEVDRDDHDPEEDDHPHGGVAESGARRRCGCIDGTRAEAPARGPLAREDRAALQATLVDLLELQAPPRPGALALGSRAAVWRSGDPPYSVARGVGPHYSPRRSERGAAW